MTQTVKRRGKQKGQGNGKKREEKERKGKERKGKKRKGKERKGKRTGQEEVFHSVAIKRDLCTVWAAGTGCAQVHQRLALHCNMTTQQSLQICHSSGGAWLADALAP